jgi:hypothetical protein
MDLSLSLIDRAELWRVLGRLDAARADLDEAILALGALRKVDPRFPGLDSTRCAAHQARAAVLTRLGTPRAALPDWEAALGLARADEVSAARLGRCETLARAGEHDRAAEEAADLSRLSALGDDGAYTLAVVFSLSAAAAHAEQRWPLPRRERVAEERARQAVAMLARCARARQFREEAKRALLREGVDLTYLRGRADFRAFIAGLPGPKE